MDDIVFCAVLVEVVSARSALFVWEVMCAAIPDPSCRTVNASPALFARITCDAVGGNTGPLSGNVGSENADAVPITNPDAPGCWVMLSFGEGNGFEPPIVFATVGTMPCVPP
jgi:hypothetical protein